MSVQRRSQFAPGAQSLADAARALASIAFGGRAADVALAPFASATDRAAVQAITLGSVRWFLRLQPAIERLLARPQDLAPEVRALLIAAAHQVEYSRNPPQSTANAAVDAVRILGQRKAAGLINAVLRRFVAGRGALLADIDTDAARRSAHPPWLVACLHESWPEQAAAILEANNRHPPMTLRVDTSRISVADYLSKLRAQGLSGQGLAWSDCAVVLERPAAVSVLPGFADGEVSVQDAGAQLAAVLLDAAPGMRVLDACAAPGGKTGHLLERGVAADDLTAVDADATRVGRIRDNLRRLRRQARVVVADVRAREAFWDGRPFERILLDAPCSAIGVIRRHPDIKLLRREDDIAGFAQTQQGLLQACFSMLAAGGRLLYVTCSVLPAENGTVLEQFLAGQPQARAVPLSVPAPGALSAGSGQQLFPGEAADTDGYYYACLEKTTS